MNKFLLLTLSLFIAKLSLAQVSFTDSNLPIIIIDTDGDTIIDEEKITSNMGIIWNGPGIRNYTADPFNNYNGKIGIEIRGSTSQQYPKKSYGLETRDSLGNRLNVALLGMPSENDWVLYGAYPDKSLMRNEITFHLFSKMQPWSPRFVFCELVINDQYMGVYSLVERIKRDKNRLDIAELDSNDIEGDSLTGGYIIKIDKLTGSSLTTWTSPYQDKLQFLCHDPEDVELHDEQFDYIKNYVTDFENTIYSDIFMNPVFGYRSYIDVNSFIYFFIMQELGRTVDGYRSSSFMFKDKGEKLCAGPMWDFNLSYGNADYCDAYDTTGWQYNFADICDYFTTEPPNWWERFLEDTTYTRQMKCRWEELRAGILHTDSINNWIDSVANYLDESQERNFTEWDILGEYVNWNYFIGDSYQEEIDYLKWWFKARSAWMDVHLPGNCPALGRDSIGIAGVDTIETGIENFYDLNSMVYPNPFSSSSNFVFDAPLLTVSYLIIYNILGEKIKEIIILPGERSAVIFRDQLSAGMYFYELVDQVSRLAEGKFMID